jgi:predicted enzyme related to lactoylglutathione lyase
MSEETSSEMDATPGIFGWNELMTPDAEASAKFYSALFGWTREDMDVGGSTYGMFKTGGRPVAGMIPAGTESVPAIWMGYVTVEDLETSLAKAVELGAKVHKGIITNPMGRFAIIADPHGALIGLWQFAIWPDYAALDIELPERGGA